VVLSGTLRLVTSASRLRFAFEKTLAAVTLVSCLKRLDCLPFPIPPLSPSWSSSRCSVTATPFPLPPIPQLAPCCSHFCGRSSVAIQKPASVTPVLLAITNAALAHPPTTPHQSHLHPRNHTLIQQLLVNPSFLYVLLITNLSMVKRARLPPPATSLTIHPILIFLI